MPEVVKEEETEVATIDELPAITNQTLAQEVNVIGFSKDQVLDPLDDTPPSARVKRITPLGVVTIEFSEEMFTPDYKLILEQARRNLNTTDREADQTDMEYFWYSHKGSLLDISIKANDYYEFPRDLSFKWTVLKYERDTMSLQLQFQDAVIISSGP